jgi:hypothetical protein
MRRMAALPSACSVVLIVTALLISMSARANAEPLRFRCAYPTWSDNEGAAKPGKNFTLEFAVDAVTNKAVMIGNAGVEEGLAHKGSDGVTFLKFLPAGAVQTTAITSTGESVHSRHTVMAGKIVPSQYYGQCF